MLVVQRGGAPKKRVVIDLGRGAIAHARVLDAFEIKLVAAEARAEWAALAAGAETKRVWASLTPARRTAAEADPGASFAMLSWMQTVLLAAASVETLAGVEEVLADGTRAPLSASFEAFELLFIDAEIEHAFKARAGEIEQIWSAEKNVSGPGPNGSGPVDTNSAPAASTTATPAPVAETAISPIANGDPARSAPTPPAPPKANSPPSSATGGAGA